MRQLAAAKLVVACAPIGDGLTDAKAAHADEGSEESQAAKRAAMATMHETRAWLRAKDLLTILPGRIAGLEAQLAAARRADDDGAAARVRRLEEQLAAARAKHERVQRQFGPLVAAMDELAAAGGDA
ncbi:hypothetical protein [Nonomuraea bangladeshensis]|uniref:hypothetical protein n=1 Tax=Nonomuraea bangladeshensis TaxID=404385 RepID=UPI003C2F8404